MPLPRSARCSRSAGDGAATVTLKVVERSDVRARNVSHGGGKAFRKYTRSIRLQEKRP